ncbi:alkane 1-monooxygenase [Zooshikella harenae]|uniref:Alkane 1-monooxygenase n=1 Tax=Zooshikella harenae TaxID=2827238 RepID=A0ABS5ZCS5_9GAMM|nr:alkane 1-monooxygenase [Zooshikella harenae]MBU2711857.1 alkane 1-monooxygenase [Zooshikella harenae]
MLSPYCFLLAYLVSTIPLIGWYLGGTWNLLFLFFYLLFPAADLVLGRSKQNPTSQQERQLLNDYRYKFIICGYSCIQLCYLALGFYSAKFDVWTSTLALSFSTGFLVFAGAINISHELVHRNTKHERLLGGFMLMLIGYATFKVEHVRGHHVNVATPQDASTAKLGQSIYLFLPQAIIRNIIQGFKLEAIRLNKKKLPFWHWQNELLWWSTGTMMLWTSFTVWAGLQGLLFISVSSICAILSLEIVNYVEHYGLVRKQLPDGRYERVSPIHSWNASEIFSNAGLFNLQRHSDHHAHPARRYQILRHFDESPQLPSSYGAMMLLALIPPLWRMVMDSRVIQYRQDQKHSLN